MRPQTSIRQAKKSEGNSPVSANSIAGFNRKRLIKELLSLGNPKISTPIAEHLSLEVEKQLQQKEETQRGPQLISELVRFKLEEMGLIEIKNQKEKIRKLPTEKAMKVTHPFMPQKIPLRLALQNTPLQAQKEKLQWHKENIKGLQLGLELLGIQKVEDVDHFLDKMCHAIAEVDSHFEGFHDNESTAIQFFNRFAALDFIPGSLLFKTNFESNEYKEAPNGYSIHPNSENIYESIAYFSKHNTAQNMTLGIELPNTPDAENAALFLLKLFKTSLDFQSQQQGTKRQDLYISFSSASHEHLIDNSLTDENDHEKVSSPFSSLFEWVEQEENRKYFSLSLGIPGRTSPNAFLPESSGPNLVRILHQHLLVNSSMRLYFLERCLEAISTPQVKADRIPHPQSPGIYAPGEVVPSLFLNLSVMVKEEEIDWDRLRRACRQAVHFLDNVIDHWSYENKESEKITKSNRSIALGLMGLADLLFILRVPYNSQEALDLAEKLAAFVKEEAIKASEELAKTRGVFPNYIGSRWQEKGIALRNAQICAIHWDALPAMIAQTSIGIESHNSLVELEGFEGEKPKYLIHPYLAQTARKRGFLNDKILARILEMRSVSAVQEIPDDIRKVFVNSSDIHSHWHLMMASVFEKHFDQGVAKACPITIDANQTENIQNILEQARELGLKSLWLKREGEVINALSPELALEANEAILDNPLPEIPETEIAPTIVEMEEDATQVIAAEAVPPIEAEKPVFIQARERPELLHGTTQKYHSCCGDVFVTLNKDEKGPYEVLAHLSKSMGNENTFLEVISRLISLALQSGIDPRALYESLQGALCLRHLNTPQESQGTPLQLLAKELEKLLPQAEIEDKTEIQTKSDLMQ